jgi:hypothetical protein
MSAFSVACIVEGHGEVPAVPILIRRLVELVNPALYANVQHPIRKSRGTLLREGGIEGAVELAVRGLPELGFVLIIIDSDDSCPKELAPELLARALRTAAGRRPVGVVLAKMEFESWFIAAAESIAGHSGLPPNLVTPADPESIRGAKEWLQEGHASWQGILADHRPTFVGEQVRSQCRPARAVLRQDVPRDRTFLFSRDSGLKVE